MKLGKESTILTPSRLLELKCRDFLSKMHRDIELLSDKMTNSNNAMLRSSLEIDLGMMFVLSYHLIEWFYDELGEQRSALLYSKFVGEETNKFLQMKDVQAFNSFRDVLLNQYPRLKIAHDIATAAKHNNNVSLPKVKPDAVHIRAVDHIDQNDKIVWNVFLEIGERKLDSIDVLNEVLRDWENLLGSEGLIEDPISSRLASL